MKITQEQQIKAQEFHNELIRKAWSDSNFKDQLINEPLEAISLVRGNKPELPEGTKVLVEDQTDDTKIFLNIPRKVNLDDFELADEEMEAVAGGIVVATLGIAAGVVTLVGFGMFLFDATHPENCQ